MRKWMRERMTRRKKGDGAAPKEQENTPVPLQPRYFEGSEAAEKTPAVSAARDPEPDSEPQVDNDSQAVVLAASEDRPGTRTEGRPSRRRRGRGGRGRGARPKVAGDAARLTPQPAAAPAISSTGASPAAAAQPSKGSVVLAIGLPGSGKSSWF